MKLLKITEMHIYIYIHIYTEYNIYTVVTKDLPISPRFTPYDFFRDVNSALLQLVNQWLNLLTRVL